MTDAKNLLLAAAAFLLCGLFCTQSFYYGRRKGRGETIITPPDTLYVHDTIVDEKPVPYEVRVIDTVLRQVRDTIWMDDELWEEVAMVRKTYVGEGYWCQVSGIEPQLDSIRVQHTTAYIDRPIVQKERYKPKFTFGVQLGIGSQYGLVNKHFDVGPYLGIGVQYNF